MAVALLNTVNVKIKTLTALLESISYICTEPFHHRLLLPTNSPGHALIIT